jgi:hypothetical protein
MNKKENNMILNTISPKDIIKEESMGVIYFKKMYFGIEAELVMTNSHLYLEADDCGIMRRGILAFLPFLKKKLQKIVFIFNLPITEILSIRQGKYGANPNILVITDKKGLEYRIAVKNYAEWEHAILQIIKP